MIGALLSSRIRTWVVLAVAAPIGAWALERAADESERRQGDTRTTRALRQASAAADKVSRRKRSRRTHQGRAGTAPR
ncbi:MAG TPA: hypothetical protein VNB94_08175 [Mycobacteriales bacterium]|nr:hypothetical protein [Mycobacteriales bacterium]